MTFSIVRIMHIFHSKKRKGNMQEHSNSEMSQGRRTHDSTKYTQKLSVLSS